MLLTARFPPASVGPFAPDNTGNKRSRDQHDKNDRGDTRHWGYPDKNTPLNLTLSLTGVCDGYHRVADAVTYIDEIEIFDRNRPDRLGGW
jgi:hypothetical protein